MQPHRKILLTGAALFCRCAAWYPVWLLLLSLCQKAGMLPAMGILLLCAFAAAAAVRIVRMHFRPSSQWPRILSAAVILSAAAASGWFVYRLTGSVLTAGVLTALTVFVPQRHIDAEPDMLFPDNGYIAFLTGSVLVSILLSAAHLPVSSNLTLGTVGGLSAVYFLLRNQFMLLRFVNRRSRTETDVPREIRRSNLALVTVVIVLLTLVWIFRAPLVQLLEWMIDAAKWAVFTVLKFLTAITAKLGGDAPEASEGVDEAEMISQYYTGRRNPLWLLLWVPIIAVTVHIWRVFLSDWAEEIRYRLGMLLKRLRSRNAENDAQRPVRGEQDYYDTETVLRKEQSRKKRQAQWRKSVLRWQKQPDSAEKFYEGYRLMLAAPCWAADELQDSDTVREIREKWLRQHTPPELLNTVTDAFHTDRYAELGLPADAIAELGKALLALSENSGG
ncbi:MAG: hypothetical protein IKQ91_01100 [Oscillospiraceae bacterium]|nr:hypothetical protein [Oscillospiraceae bacterium]